MIVAKRWFECEPQNRGKDIMARVEDNGQRMPRGMKAVICVPAEEPQPCGQGGRRVHLWRRLSFR